MLDKREIKLIEGPAGKLEVAINRPRDAARGVALIGHPHPLHGGTIDNKVVQTLANTFIDLDSAAYRMSFRGVGKSEGSHDHGIGETEDMLLVAQLARAEYGEAPLFLAGFSFGCYVQTRVAQRLSAHKLVLVAPAVGRFDVGAVPNDTLVIHGESDDVVSLSAVLDWARPQHLPIVVIPGADHFFHRRLNIIRSLVTTVCRF